MTNDLGGAWVLAAALAVAACNEPPEGVIPGVEVTYTEKRQPCQQHNPVRILYFGDLHFHTRHSWDAYGYHVRATPKDSYAFARGGSLRLPPLDSTGTGTREVRLQRPLDFAAVTDHGEYFGEVRLCQIPGTKAYESASCKDFRKLGTEAVTPWGMRLIMHEGNKRMADICGADGAACKAAAKEVWKDIQQAAEQAYDRTSQCTFVSMVGYEYTATPVVTNLHRNVIFRTDKVIPLPITYYEQPNPWGLWDGLREQCLDAGAGCDVMVIPHNMNWSNGTMFHPDQTGKKKPKAPAAAAALRLRMEPIMEMFQHKGDMECANGLTGMGADDPLCGFEKLRPNPPDCGDGTGWGAVKDSGCVSRLDFVRGIYLRGLAEERKLGLNPYRLGIIGSTDSHNGTPGNTWEQGFPGHVGTSDDTAVERLGEGNMTHRGRVNNAGGLAAVWAVERSRDAIFEAMRRREVYATSGTRIKVRFFGGWELPDDLCQSSDLARIGYTQGVAMGGVLGARPGGAGGPIFVLEAEHDPGTKARPGTLLQQAQIIKGWIDAKGKSQIKVYTVAGDAKNGVAVDPKTCKQTGSGGSRTLCAVWQDPAFDASQRAFYYARVVENPTCRWSTWECIAFPKANPKGCADKTIEKVIQERAWTSAIWYRR